MKYVRDQERLNQFGRRLRQVRQAKGFTQESLAAAADLELSQIGRIERGAINTSLSTVFILARALQLDVRELFNFSAGGEPEI
ncbi:helix-turn-helix domain-containing protein [Hymenobacter metallicola]|uniref:XRE family transcriptional regulator n=1 Tax=Hymenobacter metallicola TaxID=2563114 RepID=A0A4Z0Q1X9_9BACT|nr:helix-turn-helix transcriptional regulator [Hymenobacter metallicola]TGE22742.1 XRE family transcriptional regulator [Hymenobacter metallicola]